MPVQAAHSRRLCHACFAEIGPRRIITCGFLLSSLLIVSALTAAQANRDDAKLSPPELNATGSALKASPSLTCRVRNLLGRPLSGISVEVRSVETHATITRAMSGSNGSVVFYGLLPGRYEVTVAGGLLPPRQEMQVDAGGGQTVLELPLSQARAADMVSVRQLSLPRKARETLDSAMDAWQKQQWKKARTQATQALSLYPDYAAALALLGFLDLQDGHLETASENLKRAIESDPNLALAYVALGSAYNSMSHYEAALETLSVFPSIAADTWQVHYELARAFIGLRKYALGLREIDSSLGLLKQDHAVLRLARAHALLGLHRDSEAVAELEAIVRKDPKGPYASDAQSLLADVHSHKQQ